jgi:hypothetical protein
MMLWVTRVTRVTLPGYWFKSVFKLDVQNGGKREEKIPYKSVELL